MTISIFYILKFHRTNGSDKYSIHLHRHFIINNFNIWSHKLFVQFIHLEIHLLQLIRYFFYFSLHLPSTVRSSFPDIWFYNILPGGCHGDPCISGEGEKRTATAGQLCYNRGSVVLKRSERGGFPYDFITVALALAICIFHRELPQRGPTPQSWIVRARRKREGKRGSVSAKKRERESEHSGRMQQRWRPACIEGWNGLSARKPRRGSASVGHTMAGYDVWAHLNIRKWSLLSQGRLSCCVRDRRRGREE